ncbi:MAG TPA: hypothetical protein PLV06_12360 [Bacteroidales bacterium]|nr:hypothetical protein [Bacteroidales bacterium]HPF02490.1 hypothetical protein [Bacteroidales bacterium]HPJ59062.1 hypothetical protein [Bacteroidales bacterium]HPR13172.1 hypothetical protein [Bacteroidales bacterium]HRW84752.1 hypothetical protein [Bacteroidales bacterium]
MKNIVSVSVLAFLFSIVLWAQPETGSFCFESTRLNTAGMCVLGGWAVANMALGTWGWINHTGEQKYFSQMNFFWNTVNLAIAGFSLHGSGQIDCSSLGTADALARQMNTEKVLLINAGLDAAYIGTGILLRHLATRSEKRGDLLKGYGNSVILQGAFLMIFDLSFYGILHGHRPEFISGMGLSVSPAMTGMYLAFKF